MGNGFLLEVEQGEDHAFLGGEGFQESGEQGARLFGLEGAARAGLRRVEEGIDGGLFAFAEVGPHRFAIQAVSSERFQADVEGQTGDPIFQGSLGVVSVEGFEELNENVLRQILQIDAARAMVLDDPQDLRIEGINEGLSGLLICFEQPALGEWAEVDRPFSRVN